MATTIPLLVSLFHLLCNRFSLRRPLQTVHACQLLSNSRIGSLSLAATVIYLFVFNNTTSEAQTSELVKRTGGPEEFALGMTDARRAGTALRVPEASRQTRRPLSLGDLPLSFEANAGQTDSRVQFLARGQGYNIFLTANEAVFAFQTPASASPPNDSQIRTEHAAGIKRASERLKTKRAVMRMQLLGANSSARADGLDKLLGKVNYFRGNDPAQWRTNVPTYGKVKYTAVYAGVDLVYYGNSRQLEYDFVIGPGGDPAAIKLGFEGAKHVEINAQGALVLSTGVGEVRLQRPLIYQEINGERKTIDGNYVAIKSDAIGLEVGSYDRSRPLIIDPVLVYATYLGGSDGGENGRGIAVDGAGNAYVTGHTGAIDFPTVNPLQPELSGETDVFVSKLNPSGSALVYSTYIGGTRPDEGTSIVVDAAGNAYITGSTESSDFPTVKAFQAGFGGGLLDAFAAKLNPTGSVLVYSSYLGGGSGGGSNGGAENGNGIAVDSFGNAYVTGNTQSTDFPTVNALQSVMLGGGDAFVTKINASGTALVYSTYIGGSGGEVGNGIAVDLVGNAYVTGVASCDDFPTTPGAFSTAPNGGAFVTKINASGTALVYSTCIGGSSGEAGNGIAVDSAGNAYITGLTGSTDFLTVNPLQSDFGGIEDAFVIKLNPTGSALVYSTYIGGSNTEVGNGIAVDSAGNAYVTGLTFSNDFPTTPGSFGTAPNGGGEAFVAKLNPTGSGYVYTAFLSGSYGNSVAVDPAGSAYVVGQTGSGDFSTTPGAFQPTGGPTGGGNVLAFVAKVAAAPSPSFAGTPGTPNCFGKSVSALARQYGGLQAAASALGFENVQALQGAIKNFCGR